VPLKKNKDCYADAPQIKKIGGLKSRGQFQFQMHFLCLCISMNEISSGKVSHDLPPPHISQIIHLRILSLLWLAANFVCEILDDFLARLFALGSILSAQNFQRKVN